MISIYYPNGTRLDCDIKLMSQYLVNMLPIDLQDYIGLVCHKYIDHTTFINANTAELIKSYKDSLEACHIDSPNDHGICRFMPQARYDELTRQEKSAAKASELSAKFNQEAHKTMKLSVALGKLKELNKQLYDKLGGFQLIKMQLELIQLGNCDESLYNEDDRELMTWLETNKIEII